MTITLVSSYPEYNVFVYDKLDYCSSLKGLSQLEGFPNYHFIKGDIQCPELVNHVLKEKSIDIIIHLAAQTHVDNSFGDSIEFTKCNIYGTHILLEAAKNAGIKRFIHVSTDEVYGECIGPDLVENSILAPTNPYSATKAAAEMLVLAYHKSFNLPIIISRSNNVYGPYQYPEKVIPKFICSILHKIPLKIHGQGTNTRRYLYVSDVVDALVIVLKKGVIGSVYNIGTDFEISNLDLAEYLLKKFDLDLKSNIQFVADRAFNDMRYAIDSTKMESIGWKPKISFDQGIEWTCKTYFI